ncbi:3-oxoacyl-[acyl-carrier-protein] reductase [Streptomyces sp. LX-29]|uniref:3-oxoacyl-[acyl-carrier-protein] reductase n=1 Tax=Streptomyces sp. LX-29 TaxID=2900152 RepID=UPI00240E181E|nr:3-oxoacyl-[acyl-carrier-protein] reductase [Streptomyces sp. LX-29]WFB09326.1 3-oxoacyl-[acyl-carrier-protein] reductase [Streptomyces sp. LX-29]
MSAASAPSAAEKAVERKVALVSGGSRGIGRAAALRLARDGFDVAFCYQSNPDAARALEKEAEEEGLRIVGRQADVSDATSVREFVAWTEERLGAVEVVVTSAGITRDNPLLLMKDEDWHRVVDVNLNGTYNVCRAVVFEMMKRKSGCIINISSVAGVYGNATQTNYAATKAGIIGFTKSLAKEGGRYNIRVNAIAPGFIDTDMTSVLTDSLRTEAVKGIPLRRFGTADEVADGVSYLVRAGYVTGSVLQIDGGIIL